MPSIIKFFEASDGTMTPSRYEPYQQQLADAAAKRSALVDRLKKSAADGQAATDARSWGMKDLNLGLVGDVRNSVNKWGSNVGRAILGMGPATATAANPPTATPPIKAPAPSSAEAQFRVQNSSAPAPAPKHSPAPAAPASKQTDSTMTASEQARRGNYSSPSTNSTMTASEQARRGNYSAPEQVTTPPSTPKQAPAAPAQAEYKDSWMTKKTPEQVAATTPITQQMKAVSAPKPARQSNEQLMAKAKQDAINTSNADKKANPQDYDQNGKIIAPSSVPQAPVGNRDLALRSMPSTPISTPKPPPVGQEEQFRVDNSKPSIVDKLKATDNEDTMNNVLNKGKSMLGSFSNLAVDK